MRADRGSFLSDLVMFPLFNIIRLTYTYVYGQSSTSQLIHVKHFPLHESSAHAQLACVRGIYKARVKDDADCFYNQRCLGNAIANWTRQWHCATPSMVRQRCHSYDSRAWCILPLPAIRLKGSLPIKLGGLRSITSTDGSTWAHFYQHRRPQLGASASSPQYYGTLHRTS
jgi:hypothetical protein